MTIIKSKPKKSGYQATINHHVSQPYLAQGYPKYFLNNKNSVQKLSHPPFQMAPAGIRHEHIA